MVKSNRNGVINFGLFSKRVRKNSLNHSTERHSMDAMRRIFGKTSLPLTSSKINKSCEEDIWLHTAPKLERTGELILKPVTNGEDVQGDVILKPGTNGEDIQGDVLLKPGDHEEDTQLQLNSKTCTNEGDLQEELVQKVSTLLQNSFGPRMEPYKSTIVRRENLAKGFDIKREPKVLVKQNSVLLEEAFRCLKNIENALDSATNRALSIIEESRCDVTQCGQRLVSALPEIKQELLLLFPQTKNPYKQFEFDRCKICATPLQLSLSDSVLSCSMCGSTTECPDPGGMSMSVTYYNLDKRSSLLVHKRLGKLKDFLKQLLAKQKSVVPISVIMDVTAHIVKVIGRQDKTSLKYQDVRLSLTTLDMKSFLDYSTQIYCRIKGCQPPKLSSADKEALFVLFAALQDPFDKMKERASSTFFSMNYVVLTLCKFLRLSHIIPFIQVSNTRTRIISQQILLEKIFSSLGWKPFPLLTEEELQ